MAAATVTKELTYHGTLTANAADSVTIKNPSPTLTIVNRDGTDELYFTVNGVTAVYKADNTYMVPAVKGEALTVSVPQPTTPTAGVTVSIISGTSTTPAYSVEVI